MNKDRTLTKRIVQHAEARGIKGLFITVDAPQLGRREKVCLASVFALCMSDRHISLAGYADEVRRC